MSNQNSWSKGWLNATSGKPADIKPTQTWQEKQAREAGHSFGKSQKNHSSYSSGGKT